MKLPKRIDSTLDDGMNAVCAAYAVLPTAREVAKLLSESRHAEARGYYNPDEDERLRESYTRYLAIRVALWDVIQSLKDETKNFQSNPETASALEQKAFLVSFSAAEIIVRTGEFLIDLARGRKLVWKKLDEADARYGLPRKSFTRLYRQLTSALRMNGFYRACQIYDAQKSSLLVILGETELDQSIRDILENLNLPTASRGDHLRRYRRFVRHSLKRRQGSALRNVVFSVFEMMGSDIADLKIPLAKPPRAPKRVTDDVRNAMRDILEPGDVFVTRHDDAMSNLFLPGFWPHAALWLGAEDADILEAKKDGVLLRNMDETLQVDAFVVLRPRLDTNQITEALTRARSHTGKLYDFIFDFSTSDRLVCTEVVYRTYHGVGPIDFQLSLQAGRHCLSAEDLLNQTLQSGWFDVVALYGVGGDIVLQGETAKNRLRKSFASTF